MVTPTLRSSRGAPYHTTPYRLVTGNEPPLPYDTVWAVCSNPDTHRYGVCKYDAPPAPEQPEATRRLACLISSEQMRHVPYLHGLWENRDQGPDLFPDIQCRTRQTFRSSTVPILEYTRSVFGMPTSTTNTKAPKRVNANCLCTTCVADIDAAGRDRSY